MKKILLLLICCFLLAACSMASKSNTLEMARVGHETEVEALPVAADLRVLEQKATGEAIGKIAKHTELEMEALAKALGQNPPSVDKPDVLVGANVFTEKWSDSIKVTITGYPAYYANFHTATEEDILRLGIVKLGSRPALPDSDKSTEAVTNKTTETAADKASKERKSTTDNYFTLRYMLPFSEGITVGNINIGGGWAWKSGNFIGFELGLTPFSIFGDEWSAGGGMNFGRAFDLQYFQLFGGLSAGFWLAEKRKTIQVAKNSGGDLSYRNEDVYFDKVNVLGAFIGGRWNILELTYRIFPDIFGLSKGVYPMKGDGWHHQLMIGIQTFF
ncbi:MAG: hypothetical protein LBH25_00485 [Fibromonadaceae bacterium]|jgi:hypothetical protein|nr:hypothetical protein [Fibromonadaceae bacterium]